MTTSPQYSARKPPCNLEAERALLSGILLRNSALNSVINILAPSDFFRESHQVIYQSMCALNDHSTLIDLVSLKSQLEKDGQLDVAGGVAALGSLFDEGSSAANIEYYARLVHEKAVLRKLIEVTEEITDRGYQAEGDVRDLVESAESAIFQIAQAGESRGPKSIKDVMMVTFENLDKISKKPELITGTPSGFSDLDKMLAGMHGGELIIVAARPAMGKTTFGLNIAAHVGTHLSTPVLIFSLEMTEEQLVQRMLCAEAEVDGQELRTGYIRQDDWAKIAHVAIEMSRAPIFIDDSPSLGILEMRSRARRIKSRFGLGLIMVDYLQLMQGRRDVESRQREISEISRSLKFMAKELDCPVIALSQLSRAVESRTGNRPQLSDLRESGAIEQDADVVIFLYRPEYYKIKEIERDNAKMSSAGVAEIIVAKQRSGPTGSVFLAFIRNSLKFRDLADDIYSEIPAPVEES